MAISQSLRLLASSCGADLGQAPDDLGTKHGPPLWGGCESHKLPSDTRSVFSIGCVGVSGEILRKLTNETTFLDARAGRVNPWLRADCARFRRSSTCSRGG